MNPTTTAHTALQAQIIRAYQSIIAEHRTTNAGANWVRLARILDRMDPIKAEFDAAIIALSDSREAAIITEANRKTLTEDDRYAAVFMGGQDNHLIDIYGL
jgi:hypothetical protein